MKNIKVSEGVWEKLMKMKIEGDRRKVNDVIEDLLEDY